MEFHRQQYSSRGSSWPRDWTWISCTEGRFFIREIKKQRFPFLLTSKNISLPESRVWLPWVSFLISGTIYATKISNIWPSAHSRIPVCEWVGLNAAMTQSAQWKMYGEKQLASNRSLNRNRGKRTFNHYQSGVNLDWQILKFKNKNKNKTARTSLVSQWIRFRLLMQGTQVRSLVRKECLCHRAAKPLNHSYGSLGTLGPALHTKRSQHLAKSAHLDWGAACSSQLEKRPRSSKAALPEVN